LIDYDANVNAKNNYGVTAIMNAAQWGHIHNVDCLIAEGADINAKSKSGETAMKFAELSDHKDVIELLKNHGAK
jgi:serine/threonine-protein phosphatase 6 regulatory ankyrin repeat subunit A